MMNLFYGIIKIDRLFTGGKHMLNIALEDTVTISRKEYNSMKAEIKKLRAGAKFDNEIRLGLVSALEGGKVRADEALGRLKAKDETRVFID